MLSWEWQRPKLVFYGLSCICIQCPWQSREKKTEDSCFVLCYRADTAVVFFSSCMTDVRHQLFSPEFQLTDIFPSCSRLRATVTWYRFSVYFKGNASKHLLLFTSLELDVLLSPLVAAGCLVSWATRKLLAWVICLFWKQFTVCTNVRDLYVILCMIFDRKSDAC